MDIKRYKPPFEFYIDYMQIEEGLRDLMYESAIENEYRMFNYSDGDFYFIVGMTDVYTWLEPLLATLPNKQELAKMVLEKKYFAISIYQ